MSEAESQARSPLVTASGLVLDDTGHVLLLGSPGAGPPRLPGGAVAGGESPESCLARELRSLRGRRGASGAQPQVGRLLAVDSEPLGPRGRTLVTHVHAAVLPGGAQTADAVRLTPEEARRTLPEPQAAQLSAALTAWHTGSIAHLIDGRVQPGSPAALPPARRSALEHRHALDHSSYLAVRPKVIVAASVLFTDGRDRLVLVQPAYRDDGLWHLPGGGVDCDTGETPRQAAQREVREELGLDRVPGRLLGINWTTGAPAPARLVYAFDGGSLSAGELAAIRLDTTELRAWRPVPLGELASLVLPSLYDRIRALLACARSVIDCRTGLIEAIALVA
ncbi:NUDIX domain-containing protein [Streptomyces sp. NPDC004647]|uniref:NUDIX hydrolase n=1 Tax=Streptomyces sp. NPDC004647 TaxID=3154671 RepID=UPI0033AFB4F5